jgi:hypothetical protein
MSHLSRIVAWASLGLVLLIAAPAAASAAAVHPADPTCPADMIWHADTQTCEPIG